VFYQTEEAAETEKQDAAQDQSRELVTSAFDKGRLKLLFQPIISLHGDEDEQFEVLLRLIDNDNNELRPSQFMEIVHAEGLSIKLDRWIILQSIKLLAAHRSEGNHTRLFINVSHKTIADDTFLAWVNVAVKAARLPIDAVVFQFHESDAITYLKQASLFTEGLKGLNCKSSINHFGCSLDPFNTLKHLAVDYAKLDGSYAKGIESNAKKSQELVDTIKSLQAKGVLTAIAGVESPMVMSTLWEAGVNYIQGHYLSEPLETMDYDFASEDM
jgi:EAL domain-containing protein (putative c-di-GMP-specific phosphodiesterase class I)